MKEQAYFLGIDIGTSSVRAVLFEVTGKEIAKESVECSIISSLNGFAELDAEAIFLSTLQVVQGCLKKAGIPKQYIYGMGFSCHMHSLMAVDKKGDPLTRLMIWADTRATKEAQWLAIQHDTYDLYKRTGCRVGHPMYPLSKLLWLKNSDPSTFEKAYKWITIKEFILHKLYGEYVVDYTLASSQGYFNLHQHDWDSFILENVLEISRNKLSPVAECTYVLKHLKKEYAAVLGLDESTCAVIGSGDGIMANLGCGVLDDTALSSTIGTSGALRTTTSKPLLDPEQRTWCYAFTKDKWVAGGAINNGGLVLKWLRETFKQQFEYDAKDGESIYQVFDRFASDTPVASDGLIFMPYLTGERSPDWKAHVRGLMYGLDYSHGKNHIVRAAMEGVMYRMYSVYEVLSQLTSSAKEIHANGGYIQSELWLQIQADLFNKELLVSGVSEASALGAAFLTMGVLGATNLDQPLPAMKAVKSILPREDNHQIYLKAYQLSQQIYGSVYGSSKL